MTLTPDQLGYCQRIAEAAPEPTAELAARLAVLLPPDPPAEAIAS